MSDLKLESEEVAEVLRTQAPPPGFENFATALGAVVQAPTHTFGVALDPFKPADIIRPPGASFGVPPRCPVCHSLLQAIAQNGPGDTLFECLFDGYEGVFRVGSQAWEPRPNRPAEGWAPPRFGDTPEQSRPGPAVYRPPASPRPDPVAIPPVRQPMKIATQVEPAPVQPAEVEWLTLVDAAAVTGKPVNEIYKLVRKGQVPSRKDDRGRVLVNVDSLMGGEAAGG